MSGWERIGTVTEAQDALHLPDAAAVWMAVAAGTLRAERDSEREPWMIYRRSSG